MRLFKKLTIDERLSALEKDLQTIKQNLRNIQAANDLVSRNIKQIDGAICYIDEVVGTISEDQRQTICKTTQKD